MTDDDNNLSQLSKALPWLPRWLYALLSILKPYAKRIFRVARRILRRRAKHPVPKAVKGLYPYYERDGEMFSRLGRGSEIQHCMDLLEDANNRLIIVYGPSGSGKTSLLRAGIRYSLMQANSAQDTPICVYWPAVEQDASAALASTLALHRKTSYREDLTNVISSTTDRLVILIDQGERLRTDDPSHKPIFDLLKNVYRQVAPHAVQVVVAFDRTYLSQWLSFQEEAAIHGLKVPLASIPVPRAIDVMRNIMSEAKISIGDNIEKNYIQDAADGDGVSPVAIALGALVFTTWGDIEGGIKLCDYARAGDISAMLAAHVRERLGWAYVIEEDRNPFLRALISEMTDIKKNQRKLDGASADRVAEVSGLDPKRIKTYLQDLEDGRILEAIPGTDRYTIADDRWVLALRELDRNIPPLGQAALDRYLKWKRRQKGYYLRGEDLDWALSHVSEFVTGVDAMSRAVYLRKSRTAAIWRVYLGLLIAIALIAGGLVARYYVRVSLFHKQLRNANLPIEIYDDQGQFESLSIAADLRDLDWLNSSRLNDFSFTGPHLHSLNGLKSVHNLRSLDLFVDSSANLRDVGDLRNLTSLTLRNLGHIPNASVLDIASLEQLRRADLDLEGAQFSALPDLNPHLDELKIDISNSNISDLSSLLKVPEVTQLELLIDHSQIRSLAALAGLNHLKALHLSLDENQMQMLSDLEKSHASFTLALDLQPSLQAVPDLRRIRGLRHVSVRILGANPAQIAAVVQPSEWEDLSVVIGGSGIQEFPALDQLRRLNRLELGLESTALRQLPDISQLQELAGLTLNLNSTLITDLPEFSHSKDLKELKLFLRESRSISLHSVNQLPKLQSLTLDIRGAHVTELDTLARISSLEKLTLFLHWSQVHDLPNLAAMTNLHTLELNIDGDWGIEELPDISHMQSLKNLTLTLDGSHIEELPNLSQLARLERITVSLGDNSEMDLSGLEDTKTLEEVRLNYHRSAMQILPDLRRLPKLRKTTVDLSGSKIRDLNQLATIPKLEELTIDAEVKSLKGMPATIRHLRVVH